MGSLNQATRDYGSPRHHPNGRPMDVDHQRPKRDDSPFDEMIFPDTTLGKLLQGVCKSFLIKQEYRFGWARKSACDDPVLLPHPCEVVASHQWGLLWLVMTISATEEFKKELPEFDKCKALEMAATHDLPELVTGDITPVDGITPEEKHRLEAEAMESILDSFPSLIRKEIGRIYASYEDKQCPESRFVKDCDRLDFMITAFVYERQGFSGFQEFYPNSKREKFSTMIARDIAELLTQTRNSLEQSGLLYNKKHE